MRAIVVEQPGGVEQLGIREVPDPVPGHGQVLIEAAYSGCNWADIQKRKGDYPVPIEYPTRLGLEASGHVIANGRGVRGLKPGDRVAAIVGLGGYAERVAADSVTTIRLPDSLDLKTGAAFPIIALTAYHLLHSAYRLRRGQTVLVHAAAGGVGLMLCQMAARLGARVIGTVGSAAKVAEPLSFGADHVIDRLRQDFVEEVRTFAEGKGIDLVIDSLGADVLEGSIACLGTYGTVISIGEAAGYPYFPIRETLHQNSTFLGRFNLMHAGPGSARWRRGVSYVLDGLASGRLSVPIAGIFDFEDCAGMHRRLEERGVVGKLLLRHDGAERA